MKDPAQHEAALRHLEALLTEPPEDVVVEDVSEYDPEEVRDREDREWQRLSREGV